MLNKLKSNKEFMKYFFNTSWLFFDKIFKMGIGFFLIIYLTRYLGPENFGILSYAQSVVSIFMAFASLGISQVVIRDLVKFPKKRDILLGTWFKMSLFSSSFSILLLFILEKFILDDSNFYIVSIISFTIIFQNFNIIIDSYFQSQVKSKSTVLVSNMGFFLSAIVKFYFIYFEYDLIYFAYALIFDVMIVSIGFLYIYRVSDLSIFHWSFDKKTFKEYIEVSLPLVLVSVSAFIYTRTDQIMLKYMVNDEAVGNYAAAIRVSELFYFIPGIIVASLFPKIVELKKEDEKRYLKLLEKMYRSVIWISIPIAIFLYSFSNEIVNILYGSQYILASKILEILSWTIIFTSIGAVFVKILYIERYEKKYLYKSIFGVGINILLNYFLIEAFGVTGAAMGTIITMFSINYIYDLFDKDLRQFYYLKLICFIPKI